VSLPVGEVLRFVADNHEVVETLAKAIASGLTREQAIQAIEQAMTTASRERMRAELEP
jgi:hypothetical protein